MTDDLRAAVPAGAVTQAAAWHRQVAALAIAADRAGVASDDVKAVRAALHDTARRLTLLAVSTGAPPAALAPTPSEIAAASVALGDLSETSVAAAVEAMNAALAQIDRLLTPQRPPRQRPGGAPAMAAHPPAGATSRARWSIWVRNTGVYGAYSIAVIAVQVVLFVSLDEQQLPLLAPVCLLVLPALAWAAGWLSIGSVVRRSRRRGRSLADEGDRADRTPRLGVVVCLVPHFALCLVFGALSLSR